MEIFHKKGLTGPYYSTHMRVYSNLFKLILKNPGNVSKTHFLKGPRVLPLAYLLILFIFSFCDAKLEEQLRVKEL